MRMRHYLAWACVVACGVLGARALIERPEPPRIVTVTAPPTVIAIAVPPPPAPPAPPPPASAPSVHVGCGDVSTIGIPITLAPARTDGQLVDVSVSREGCVIAARSKSALSISWDGGASFTDVDPTGIVKMAAAADRVAVLLDDGSLGTIAPGKLLERHAPHKGDYGQIFASGQWTALVGDALIAVTDDNGTAWRYVVPPKGGTITALDGSRLLGFVARPTSEPDGEHLVEYIATAYANDLAHPRWHAGKSHDGTPADEEGRFALAGDAFWGCGSSDKLLDVASGASVAGGLRDEVWPISVHSTHGVTFASLSNELVRLDGDGRTKIDDMPDGRLVAVDGAGTPILSTSTQLLRWSKSGGWRVLLDASP